MRWVLALVVVALAACGRVGFGDHDDAAVSDGHASDVVVSQPFTVYVVSGDGTRPTDLLTLNLATGALTLVGTIPMSFGVLGGLAYWDANTLYAAATTDLVKITLSPFGATSVSPIGGAFSALERDGANLFGIDQDTDTPIRFTPANAAGPFTANPLPVDALGGDLTPLGGIWYWVTNSAPAQLYTLDAADNAATVGGPINSSPFLAGLTTDQSGTLWVSSNDTDAIYPVDTTTGQLGAPTQLTLGGSPYDLLSGDMTRTP